MTGAAVFTPSAADRATWLEQRRQGIGASDAAAVLGVSPWKSPLTLFYEKLGLAPTPQEETEAMEWGLLLETPIAARYAQATGDRIEDPGRFTVRRSADRPWMLATLDRVVYPLIDNDPDRRGPGILEIKTASAFHADEWREEPPLAYQVQVQHQLAVTGYRWAVIAVLIGGQRFHYTPTIHPNQRFIDSLIAEETAFWGRLQTQEPPPADGSEATKALLAQLYPRDNGKVVTLPADAVEWDRQRSEADTEVRRWQRVKDEADNALKAAMGEAVLGIVAPGVNYTWSTVDRAGYTVAPTTFRQLRRKVTK